MAAKDKIKEFLFPHLDKLGVVPDEEIAKQTSLPVRDIAAYRKKNGIKDPPPKQAPLLGAALPPPDTYWMSVDQLRTDGGTQQRLLLSEDTIVEYAEALAQGGALPAVSAMDDGEEQWLYDGFHRLEAAKRAGRTEIEVRITKGTRRDAILASVGVNANHGLRRSNADKRQAAFTLLKDEEWGRWSNGEIAKAVGVTEQWIGKLRKELAEGIVEAAPDETVSPAESGWTWGKARTSAERMARIPLVASAEEASALLATPGLQEDVVRSLSEQRSKLESIHRSSLRALLKDVYLLGYSWPETEAPAGMLSAVLARLAREAEKEGPVLSVADIRSMVVDIEEVEEQLSRQAITDPQRLALLEIAKGLERMGFPGQTQAWKINSWLERSPGLFGLPSGLAKLAREELARLEKKEKEAPPRKLDGHDMAREILANDPDEIWKAQNPAVLARALHMQSIRHGPEDPHVSRLRMRLGDLKIKVGECPNPLCEGALYAMQSEGDCCPRCYSNPKDARKNWAALVAQAPKDIEEARRILELAGKLEGPAKTLGRMTVVYVGTVAEMRGGSQLYSDDFIVVLKPDADDDLIAIKKQVNYEVDIVDVDPVVAAAERVNEDSDREESGEEEEEEEE